MKNSRKRKIRRQRRQRLFIMIVISLLFVSLFVSINTLSKGDGGNYSAYQEVYVQSGDTLWSIAKKHYGNSIDTREAVYAICESSEIKGDYIYTGQLLKLPVFD
ncbi:MAG: LysM peptidoglycan-binding domain-containing protein [Bacillota bacterium]|nr:LysM peptidoglycan-binding domain-containing protein [Bacillota bacterium]